MKSEQNLFNAIFVQEKDFLNRIYGPEERQAIAEKVEILGEDLTDGDFEARREDLAKADLLFTGWGAPDMSKILPLMPRLKVIFYAGGSASFILNSLIWEKGIQLTSSYVANAVPVAEYTLAAIIFGLKQGWSQIMNIKLAHHYERPEGVTGAYNATVGLISCGAIARELLRLLKVFNLRTLVYDPHVSPQEIEALGGETAGFEEIFALSDVVSVHTPELEETIGMIGASELSRMKPGATFINTARGSILREKELYEVAEKRRDLQFVLDAVWPEPPPPCSPLYTLPNVILTPHIAGAMGSECRRMGQYMTMELNRFLAGKPMKWLITPSLAAVSSHRPKFMSPHNAKTFTSTTLPKNAAATS